MSGALQRETMETRNYETFTTKRVDKAHMNMSSSPLDS